MSTTIETRSISDLAFPEVVVCPPKNSFTTLNPDLIRADKNSWDGNMIRRLRELVIEATFDLNVENKYKKRTSLMEKDRYLNWYTGETQLMFPSVNFYPNTSAASGRFSTPNFGETFHEDDFVLELVFHISIYVPEEIRKNGSISLVIDIDYDIGGTVFSSKDEILKVYGSKWKNAEVLSADHKKYKKEFSLQGDTYYKVAYTRAMTPSRYEMWKSKRHTGMRVSWYYNDTVQPDQKYLSDNQEFIALVNAVHENRTGLREELKRARHEFLSYYKGNDCDDYYGRLEKSSRHTPLPSLLNVSAEPIYTNTISEETLATASRLYYYFREGFIQISILKIVHTIKSQLRNPNEISPFSHCPDENTDIRNFYKALMKKFSLRTILTSLARLSLVSIESGLEKLMSSRVILEAILQDPHLGIKDYISWTTKLSQFKKKNGLMNFYSEAGDKQGL